MPGPRAFVSREICGQALIEAMSIEAEDTTKLAAEIRQRLETAGTSERREVAAWYFPSAMEPLGVAARDIRAVVRDVSRRMKGAGPAEVLALAHAVLDGGSLEGRQAAYEIVGRHRETMAALTVRQVERLGKGMDNWVSVDTFAGSISGPAWREGHISDSAVEPWARSKDRWWRRAAVVSTVPLNQKSKGGLGDSPRTLAICELVAADSDDMVAKGLSWALRALAEHDRGAVADFIQRHDSSIASLVRREVRNKLETGFKNPKRPR